MDEKTKSVVRTVRAFLTSAKDGLLTKAILEDYKQTEGVSLPLDGYSNIEEFLTASGEFILSETDAGTKVFAKESKLTAHMTKLVREQNGAKSKKKVDALAPRRALRPSTIENHSLLNTAYSKAYSQSQNANRSIKKTYPNQSKQPQLQQSSTNGTKPFRNVNNNYTEMRPILKQSNIKRDDQRVPTNGFSETSDRNGHSSDHHSRPVMGRNQNNETATPKSLTDRLTKYSNPVMPANYDAGATKRKLSDRLQMKQDSTDTVDFVQTHQTQEAPQAISVMDVGLQMNNVKLQELGNMSSVEALLSYCKQKGFDAPKYSYYRLKTGKFSCNVRVGPNCYATYPDEFDTKTLAQTDVACKAFHEIEELESGEKYPVCMDSSVEIANKIFECVSENGVILKLIPQLFQDKYGTTLPDNWTSLIDENPKMFNVATDLTERVYRNKLMQTNKNGDTLHPSNVQPDELVLPWGEKYWNVFVTSVTSTVHIWGRLIGPDYSNKWDSILDDFESELLSDKLIKRRANPESLAVGKYYFVANPDCYRIRIEQIDRSNSRALCFLIDYGDEEWWSFEQIYEGDAKLFKLAPQAIRFSLFGLEDFAENKDAKQHIDQYLAGKTLIAEVESDKAEYVVQYERDESNAKVKATFYDTSSDDDVQLNKLILEKICEKLVAPQLQKKGGHNIVYISHITNNGDIYCQMYNERGNLHIIQQIIHNLTQSGFDRTTTTYSPKTPSALYLVRDQDDSKWYRAAILANHSANAKSETCQYVDFGTIKQVARDEIYRLDLLSTALNKYPHQAIHVRLYGIDSYNEKLIARLRGLLCASVAVYAQVVETPSLIPMVNIWKRMENQVLCKINDAIRMEQEIESANDWLPDDNGASFAVIREKSKNGDVDDIQLYPMPSANEFFNVVAVTAQSPSNFFVRPHAEENEFQNLMKSLQIYCKSSSQSIPSEQVAVNQYYAGLHQDGYWYRVKIVKIISHTIVAFRLDYGDIPLMEIENLRPLPSELRKVKQLAIPARLHGIRPKNSDWDTDDCQFFRKRTEKKQFTSVVKAIVPKQDANQNDILELVLFDVSTNDQINMNNLLIAEQRAIGF